MTTTPEHIAAVHAQEPMQVSRFADSVIAFQKSNAFQLLDRREPEDAMLALFIEQMPANYEGWEKISPAQRSEISAILERRAAQTAEREACHKGRTAVIDAFKKSEWFHKLDERDAADARIASFLRDDRPVLRVTLDDWEDFVHALEKKCDCSVAAMMHYVRVERLAERINNYASSHNSEITDELLRERVSTFYTTYIQSNGRWSSWWKWENTHAWLAAPVEEMEALYEALQPLVNAEEAKARANTEALKTAPEMLSEEKRENVSLGDTQASRLEDAGKLFPEERASGAFATSLLEEAAEMRDEETLNLHGLAQSLSETLGWSDAPRATEIVRECLEFAAFLVDKNRKYGDSALTPMRVFSKASAREQILVRLDDKLSRLARGNPDKEDEDVLRDMVGYLILFHVAKREGVFVEGSGVPETDTKSSAFSDPPTPQDILRRFGLDNNEVAQYADPDVAALSGVQPAAYADDAHLQALLKKKSDEEAKQPFIPT